MSLVLVLALALVQEEETLPNGVRLAKPWPPRPAEVPQELIPPPYLASPPAVIPIDVGRQLFVDDFLVESTTLRRTFHLAKYHPASPVLRPDKPWEKEIEGGGTPGPAAMVFSDGVWYDPKDGLFKMWYMGGWLASTCLAVSKDGVAWEKPAFDVQPGTNIVHAGGRDSSTVWLDHEERDPKKRFKMVRATKEKGAWGLWVHFSADGIHWTDAFRTGECGDRSTVFWNPFRKVWVYSLRRGEGKPRSRRYWEAPDLFSGPRWEKVGDAPFWVGADALDPMREDLKTPTQLYNLDGVAYESLILGLFTIWRGQPKDRQKPNEVCVGFSRDGWHWTRPDRRAFCPVSEKVGDWNYSNVQSAGGGCLVMGDELWFYVSGRAGKPKSPLSGECTTGIAVLRRDGFASMDGEGTLTTRPVRFRGRHLFVNLAGELGVEVLEGNEVVARSARAAGDQTRLAVRWEGREDLSAFSGRPVRFRFTLSKGSLYAFWVTPDPGGASYGYVAAGGPGFSGPQDVPGVRQVDPDPASGTSAAVVVPDAPLLHTRQVMAFEPADAFADLERILKRAGSGLDRVVKLNVYVGGANSLARMKKAIAEKFAGPSKPAVSFVGGDLPGPFAMDAVATTDNGRLQRYGDAAVLPAGGRVYVSGQAERGELVEATRKTLQGLRKTLEWLGLTDADVVQLKVFFRPTARLAEVRKEIEVFYGQAVPAVYVEWTMSIPIEIELIARAPAKAEGPALEYLTPPEVRASPVYSRVARINRGPTIFISSLGAEKAGTSEDEIVSTFERLRALGEKCGSDLKHLVKATYYVSTDETSRKLNEIRPRFYDPARPPAASKASVSFAGFEGRTLSLDMIAVERER